MSSILISGANRGIGMATALAWIAALWAIAFYLDDEKKLFAAQFLGVQQCLNSIQSLFFLVQISGFGVKQSDAGNMENLTGIPAVVWSVLVSPLAVSPPPPVTWSVASMPASAWPAMVQ